MRAAAYIRVSTELQGDAGYSLEHQDTQARQEIEARGWDLGVICEEVVSAGKPLHKRGKLNRLLNDLDAGDYQALVITRLDRLCRSSRDFQNILHRAETNKWALVCLDPPVDLTTAAGQLFASMAAAFAEYERKLISQRTKEAIAVRRALELPTGGARPFDDADTLQTIHRLKTAGRSFREIAAVLNMEGIPSAQGGPWLYSTVNGTYRRWLRRSGQPVGQAVSSQEGMT